MAINSFHCLQNNVVCAEKSLYSDRMLSVIKRSDAKSSRRNLRTLFLSARRKDRKNCVENSVVIFVFFSLN